MTILLTEVYDVTLKKEIRVAAKNGFIRPTIGESFMTHKDFKEVESFVGPSTIGEFFQGGYYAGDITIGSDTYAILVAPKTGGESNRPLINTGDEFTEGTNSYVDGYANTEAMINKNPTTYTAAAFCWNLNLNGYTDWYLPSLNECILIYTNRATVEPIAGSFRGSYLGGWHWTSTTSVPPNTLYKHVIEFSGGGYTVQNAGYDHYIRAIRRVKIN